MPPEIIKRIPYSFESDIWSLGCVLYEMCALKPPFNGLDRHQLGLNIIRGGYQQIPSNYSLELKKLVGKLLSMNPESRYSVKEILALPFIRNRIKKFLSEAVRKEEFSHTILHNQVN